MQIQTVFHEFVHFVLIQWQIAVNAPQGIFVHNVQIL